MLDANALPMLRQQMRDAAQGVESSRKAVAVVIAYAEREKSSLKRIETQISDLETRALDALAKEREDLASEAAGTIAQLEAERDVTLKAIRTYQTQVNRLKQCLLDSETCLRALKQGQHLAEANDKAHRVSGLMPSDTTNDLEDAKTTLDRLQQRQEHAEATASALAELSLGDNAKNLTKRLAEEGCGSPLQSSTSSVLDRLKKKAESSAPISKK
jgi:phage shock protein A